MPSIVIVYGSGNTGKTVYLREVVKKNATNLIQLESPNDPLLLTEEPTTVLISWGDSILDSSIAKGVQFDFKRSYGLEELQDLITRTQWPRAETTIYCTSYEDPHDWLPTASPLLRGMISKLVHTTFPVDSVWGQCYDPEYVTEEAVTM